MKTALLTAFRQIQIANTANKKPLPKERFFVENLHLAIFAAPLVAEDLVESCGTNKEVYNACECNGDVVSEVPCREETCEEPVDTTDDKKIESDAMKLHSMMLICNLLPHLLYPVICIALWKTAGFQNSPPSWNLTRFALQGPSVLDATLLSDTREDSSPDPSLVLSYEVVLY